MNPPEADATKLAQEAAAMLKRSELITKEAGRFAEMARKVGGKTRPAIRLMAESDRLQTEANELRAKAGQLQAQADELLPMAEIIDSPRLAIKPAAVTTNQNVVDVEPLAPPPRPTAARIVVPINKPPVATEKWGAGMKPPTENFSPAPPISKPVVQAPKPVQEIPAPMATVAKSEPTKPEPAKTETPSPVLREVNRFHERALEKPKPLGAGSKIESAKPSFLKRIFGLGKSAEPRAKPAPASTRSTASTTSTTKPAVPPTKPTEPMFEAPKAPAPNVVTPLPVPLPVEKPTPPATPPPAPKPIAPPPPPERYVTCHCPQCEQGVEFDTTELTPDNCLIPCPNCGEEMKLSIP